MRVMRDTTDSGRVGAGKDPGRNCNNVRMSESMNERSMCFALWRNGKGLGSKTSQPCTQLRLQSRINLTRWRCFLGFDGVKIAIECINKLQTHAKLALQRDGF